MKAVAIIGIIFFSLCCLTDLLILMAVLSGKETKRDPHFIADMFWLVFFLVLLNWL